jgi:4-hydroxy-3-polyprenylbenzoate decarboxylase|tara:strand:+ start:554 stop:691 length:138 start_codon:yes stop_codon:yes gene_type:complete
VINNVASFDATNKWAGETTREWGEPIAMDVATNNKTDILWDTLGI